MKPIVKMICCSAILAWVNSTGAVEAGTVPPPPLSDGVKVYPVKKMDQAGVEKRIGDKAARTKARSDRARKSRPVQDQQTAPTASPK